MRLIPDDALAVVTIWQEARNQGPEGQLAVAEVIWRRMKTRYSSDGTVAGTVLRPWQFSGFNTDDPNRVPSFKLDDSNLIVKSCRDAWELAKAGSNTTKGAVLYANLKILKRIPAWVGKSRKVAAIGDHTFYVPLV